MAIFNAFQRLSKYISPCDYSNIIADYQHGETSFSWTAPENCWIYYRVSCNTTDRGSLKINGTAVYENQSQRFNNSRDSLIPIKKGSQISLTGYSLTLTAYGCIK